MLTYEEFEKCIRALENDEEYFANCSRMGFDVFDHVRSQEALLSLVERCMQDDEGYTSWWCYEKEFGQNEHFNCYDANGNIIRLNKVCDLYEFLVQNAEEKGDCNEQQEK